VQRRRRRPPIRAFCFARQAGDRRLEGDAYRVIGQVLQFRSQFDSAFVALHRSESLYLEARHRSALARSLIWHAQVLGSRMRYGEMRDVAKRALSEGEATHNPAAIGDAHRALGVLATMLGDWPAASAHFRRAVAISASAGDSSGVMTSGKYVAQVALAVGDVATAKRLARERLEWARLTDDANARYESYRLMANIAERENDIPAALRSLDSARAQTPPSARRRLSSVGAERRGSSRTRPRRSRGRRAIDQCLSRPGEAWDVRRLHLRLAHASRRHLCAARRSCPR
jgi:tetratricopeptide (TPR) repeat protein